MYDKGCYMQSFAVYFYMHVDQPIIICPLYTIIHGLYSLSLGQWEWLGNKAIVCRRHLVLVVNLWLSKSLHKKYCKYVYTVFTCAEKLLF